MSRINTQPDEHQNIRLSMIISNMNRISSQNYKLQQLLTHHQQLDKLREVVYVGGENWRKLAEMAEKVQGMHQETTKVKQEMHEVLAQQSDKLNATLFADIQKLKVNISTYDAKRQEIRSQQIARMKRQGQLVKDRVCGRLAGLRKECTELIQKVQKDYVTGIGPEVEDMRLQCELEIKRRHKECKIGLGHLHNLASYWYWVKHKQNLDDETLSNTVKSNFRQINKRLDGLDIIKKRVKSEVEWLKGKARKDKGISRKQKQIKYEPQQIQSLNQFKMGLQKCQFQLQALDQLCNQKSQKQNKFLSGQQISTLVIIKQRLKELDHQGSEISSFYNSYF